LVAGQDALDSARVHDMDVGFLRRGFPKCFSNLAGGNVKMRRLAGEKATP
jgi:hypothetical protein